MAELPAFGQMRASGPAGLALAFAFSVEDIVGGDDGLHEGVADDRSSKRTKRIPSIFERSCRASRRPDVFPCGRSTCVTSPVTTARDPNPMRVRNIFICSEVVFWASSKMMKASFNVRPRMNAIGAISMIPRSRSFAVFS